MLRRLIAALTLTTLSSPAFAGAWLQPEHQGLFIGQATYYTTSHYFDFDGNKQRQPTYKKYELQPYVEYGLFKNLTIGGSAYAQHVTQSGNSNQGIADPEIFARTRLWYDDKQVVSIQPLIKFNGTFKDSGSPRGGSKTTDAELSLLYGRNLPVLSNRDYLDVRAAYRTRNHGLSDQLRGDVAMGLGVTDRFMLIPALRGVAATDVNEAAVYSENGDLDYSVIKAEVTGLYTLNDQQWVQASLFKPVAGFQTGEGYGASIGFAQRF